MLQHAKTLWGPHWGSPLACVACYVVLCSLAGFRAEHGFVVVSGLGLAYATARTKRFLLHLLPIAGAGILYDLQRLVVPVFVTPERILSCELRTWDRALWSVGPDLTFQEWLIAQHHPALDVVLSVPYLIQAYAAVVYGIYLYFADRARMRFFSLAFLIGNCMAIGLWLCVPAAPPWYVHQHGCGIDPTTIPSAAGLLRLDSLFGIDYFAAYYTRTSNVFAAFPSMHNAYPLFGLLTAWKAISWKTKPLHLLYFVTMVFASMYFDHHWLVDAVAGWAVAIAATLAASYLRVARHPMAASEVARSVEPASN